MTNKKRMNRFLQQKSQDMMQISNYDYEAKLKARNLLLGIQRFQDCRIGRLQFTTTGEPTGAWCKATVAAMCTCICKAQCGIKGEQ